MPRASRQDLPVERIEAYEGRMTQMGDYNVAFERIPAGFPPHELFAGLPDDRCQCEHWGYVFRGAIKFAYADGREETFRAGDAYYVRPGHLPAALEDFEGLEFSPKAEFDRTIRQVAKNLEAQTETTTRSEDR
jgi:hypothetical protein